MVEELFFQIWLQLTFRILWPLCVGIIARPSTYAAALCVISFVISMKAAYLRTTYLLVFQGQRSMSTRISQKHGHQRKWGNCWLSLTAAMRLEKGLCNAATGRFTWNEGWWYLCIKIQKLGLAAKTDYLHAAKNEKDEHAAAASYHWGCHYWLLKNGRLDSDCDNVFIRHIHPYGEFQSSTSLSENLKRYMKYAGLTVKSVKRRIPCAIRWQAPSCMTGHPLWRYPIFLVTIVQRRHLFIRK